MSEVEWGVRTLEDLMVLQRVMLEGRFRRDTNDPPVLGSTPAGEMHRQVVDAIIRIHEARGDARLVAGWRSWRRWSGRTTEREVVLERSRQDRDSIAGLDHHVQLTYVRACVQPFDATDDEVEQLLAEILTPPTGGSRP